MLRLPPRFPRTDTLFPYTTLFRSVGLRCILVTPAALDVAADPRACGDGELACLDVAAERARLEQLHARGRFDVAVQLAGHHHLLGLDAAAELGALLDGQVALHVDVALELAGDADVAGAFDLA